MSLRRRRFLSISAAAMGVGAVGFGQMRAHQWQGLAFGAKARVTLYGERAQAVEAFAAIEAMVAEMEASFSLYDPASEISRLNLEGALARPSARFGEVWALARHVYEESSGRFDASVQPLWEGGAGAVGMENVEWVDGGFRFAKPEMALTLNGIAQGFASDQVAAILAAKGFGKALVNMGEYRALGGRFALAIENQFGRDLGRMGLDDAAVATSSPFAMMSGAGDAHILHPSGGEPLWRTVSVKAKTGALADGFSTAFCFVSEAEIGALVARHDALERVWVEGFDGKVRVVG